MKKSLEVLFNKSEQDYLTVKNLLDSTDSLEAIIAFHIQQMVEKLLKCVLIYYDKEYRPTHDLIYLLGKIILIDHTYKKYYTLIEELSPFAVLVRYEEGYDISMDEIKQLFEQSIELKNKITKHIKITQ